MIDLTILSHLKQLGIAYILVLPIGWDRERANRGAGLRTFPLYDQDIKKRDVWQSDQH